MVLEDEGFLETRSSLLGRLRAGVDEECWGEFFACYWRLIYNVARRAGLNHEDALDVVQETVVEVVRSIDSFRKREGKGSFKGWLRVLTRTQIALFFRREARHRRKVEAAVEAESLRVDPDGFELEQIWDEEWRGNLVRAAVEKVRPQVSPRQFQIFLCYAMEGWTVAEVCRELDVSANLVYVTKHRVGALFKTEIERLRRQT